MEKTLTPDHALSLSQAIPFLLDFPASRFWVDYDQEADVLYISFSRPQQATDTTMTVLRYRASQLVGVTAFDASTRVPARSQKGAMAMNMLDYGNVGLAKGFQPIELHVGATGTDWAL